MISFTRNSIPYQRGKACLIKWKHQQIKYKLFSHSSSSSSSQTYSSRIIESDLLANQREMNSIGQNNQSKRSKSNNSSSRPPRTSIYDDQTSSDSSDSFHSSENVVASDANGKNTGMMDKAMDILNSISFAIPVNGSHLNIIKSPSDFLSNINNMIRNADKRVYMATLYVGTGELESKMVDNLTERMKEKQNQLDVHIHLDYLRGNRIESSGKSSVTMLQPLKDHNASITLYHTPELSGWRQKVIPQRYNETLGLSHFKVIVVDNDVILTGANLSDSYFTNRQDRYIRFRNCPQLADFYCELVKCVGSISFHLQNDQSLVLQPSIASPISEPEDFKKQSNKTDI